MFKLGKEIFMMDSEFEKNEAEVVEVECEECGHIEFTEDGELEECENCSSDMLMNTTNIEDKVCCVCENLFDMWDDFYKNDADEYLCVSCETDSHSEEHYHIVSEKQHDSFLNKFSHVLSETLTDKWVFKVLGRDERSGDELIYHVIVLDGMYEKELAHLIATCKGVIEATSDYEEVEGYEHWFAPSGLLESDWEGMSPIIKELSKNWENDPTAMPGTPIKMTGYHGVFYDEEGNIEETIEY